MDDWDLSNLLHKHKRRAPLLDEHERPSPGPAPKRPRKKRPFKILFRWKPELARKAYCGMWSCRWRKWSAYETQERRDQALAALRARNHSYWNYKAKDPK